MFVQLQCEDKRKGRASEGHKQGQVQSEEEEEENQMPVSIDMHPAEYVSAASLVAVPSNSNAAQVKLVNNTPD